MRRHSLGVSELLSPAQRQIWEASIAERPTGRITPLGLAALLRRIGELGPLRCHCGCGFEAPAESFAQYLERVAVLS